VHFAALIAARAFRGVCRTPAPRRRARFACASGPVHTWLPGSHIAVVFAGWGTGHSSARRARHAPRTQSAHAHTHYDTRHTSRTRRSADDDGAHSHTQQITHDDAHASNHPPRAAQYQQRTSQRPPSAISTLASRARRRRRPHSSDSSTAQQQRRSVTAVSASAAATQHTVHSVAHGTRPQQRAVRADRRPSEVQTTDHRNPHPPPSIIATASRL
jgi:hypothetical protein